MGAVAAESDGGEDHADLESLGAPELTAVSDASERRRLEFAGGRACAHRALRLLGVEAGALPAGPDGAPLWPTGIVGSITHKGAYRAAAVARAGEVPGLGLDAELDAALPPGVLGRLAHPDELEAVEALVEAEPGRAWDRLLFSAKEAVVKAVQPLGRGTPGLAGVAVRLAPDSRSISASLSFSPLGGSEVALDGRWEWRPGLIVAAAWLARSRS